VSRHLLREIVRQLRESGGSGVVAVVLVFVATLLAGTLVGVRSWVVTELLSTDKPATVTVTLPSIAVGNALVEELRTRFPSADPAVLAPAEVRAELASWFPDIAGALAAVPDDGFPSLLIVQVARRDEETLASWLSQRSGGGLAAGSRQWREPLQRALAGALAGGLALTLTLLVGCCIVVLLVVRLMVLAHADEIEIMRLIGAREREIRVPYLVSGATLAGLGSLFGIASLSLLDTFSHSSFLPVHLPGDAFLVLALIGPVVGIVGALFGLAALPREP
jgi:cell division transport system permease protein